MQIDRFEIEIGNGRFWFSALVLAALAFFSLSQGWQSFDPSWHSTGGYRLTTRMIDALLNNSPPWLRGSFFVSIGVFFLFMLTLVIWRWHNDFALVSFDSKGVRFSTFLMRQVSVPWSDIAAIETGKLATGSASWGMITLVCKTKGFFAPYRVNLFPSLFAIDTGRLIALLKEMRPDLCHHLLQEVTTMGLAPLPEIRPTVPDLAEQEPRGPAAPASIINSHGWTG